MFKRILAYLNEVVSGILSGLGIVITAAAEHAAVDFDALVKKYLPVALGFVQAAANNPDLLSGAEKRSQVVGDLTQHLEGVGHDIMADGFGAFVNLLTEAAVNTLKVIAGNALKE